MEQETLRLNRMLHLRNVLKRITGHVIYSSENLFVSYGSTCICATAG